MPTSSNTWYVVTDKHGNHTANQGWQHSVLEPDDFVSYLTVVGMEFLPNAPECRQLRTAQAHIQTEYGLSLQDYKNLQDMGIYVTYLPKLTPN